MDKSISKIINSEVFDTNGLIKNNTVIADDKARFLACTAIEAGKLAINLYMQYKTKVDEIQKEIDDSHKNTMNQLNIRLEAAKKMFDEAKSTKERTKFYDEMATIGIEISQLENKWAEEREEKEEERISKKNMALYILSPLTGLPLFLFREKSRKKVDQKDKKVNKKKK